MHKTSYSGIGALFSTYEGKDISDEVTAANMPAMKLLDYEKISLVLEKITVGREWILDKHQLKVVAQKCKKAHVEFCAEQKAWQQKER